MMEKENNTLNPKDAREFNSAETSEMKRNRDTLEENNIGSIGENACSLHHAKTDHDGTLLDDTLQDVNDLQDMAAMGSKVAHMGQRKKTDAVDGQPPGTQIQDTERDSIKNNTGSFGEDSASRSAGSKLDDKGKGEAAHNGPYWEHDLFDEDQHSVDSLHHNGGNDCFVKTQPSDERSLDQDEEVQSYGNIGGANGRETANHNNDLLVNQGYGGSQRAKGEEDKKETQESGNKKESSSRYWKNDPEKEGQSVSSASKNGNTGSDDPKGKESSTVGDSNCYGNSNSNNNSIPKNKENKAPNVNKSGNSSAVASMPRKSGGKFEGMNFNKDTAQKAASLGKTAGAVTSGNPLIAAYQAAKAGPTVTKTVAAFSFGILIFIVSLTSLFLYALPTSLFEFAETYTKDYYAEKYEAAVFRSEGEIHWAKFVEGIKIGSEITGDFIEALGQSLKDFLASYIPFFSASNSDNQSKEIENYSIDGRELKVTQLESAEKSTLEDKIEAVQKKIRVRAEDIEDAVRKISDGSNSQIAQAVEAYYNTDGYYDDFQVNTTVSTYGLSKEGAIAIMGLYMVQEAGSLDNVRLSSLLKWLGYFDGTQSERLDFNVLGIPCKVKTWCGTFLPQYLNEQKHQEETKYNAEKTAFNEYQTAAADLILEVSIPEIENIPVYELKQQQEDGSIKKIGTATVNIKIQPRELEQIADLMGLWIGDLTKRQEYMPSNLSVNMIDSVGANNYGTGSYEWLEGGELIAYTPQHNLHSDFIGIQGQCTWLAADRLYQLYKETNGEYGADLTGLHMGNGGEWAANAQAYGYKVDNVAEIGKAACFVPGVTQNHPGDAWQPFDAYAGHIAIVEKVNPDGSIIVSEFWGHYVDYQVHFSYFTKETAATIQYIDFTVKS